MTKSKIADIEVTTKFLDKVNPELGLFLEENFRLIRDLLSAYSTHQGIVVARVDVINTIVETEIFSTTIAALKLSEANVFRLILNGYYDTSSASENFTLRVTFGGVLLHTVTRQSSNNASSFGWELDLMVTIRIDGSSGKLICLTKLFDENVFLVDDNEDLHDIDTTVDNDLIVTVEWDAADVGNDFHLDQGLLQFDY